MTQLARSTPSGVMLVLLSAAACSPPDWPEVAGSSGAASVSSETPDSNASAGAGPGSDPARPPPTGSAGGLGQEGNAPISGGVSKPGSGADAGARPELPVDAGLVAADASIEPPSTPDEPAEPEPEPACEGVSVGGACWYLGAVALACDDVCASHGGFAPEGVGIVGTLAQGGSIEGCTAVLEALGVLSTPVSEGFRDDGLGFGCHVFTNANPTPAAWWLSAPALSPAAAGVDVRIACSCVR